MGFANPVSTVEATISGPVALAAGTAVGITGTPSVNATGSTIDLVAGAKVGLVAGTEVTLPNGQEVALAAGTQVALAAGTAVGVSGGQLSDIGGTPNQPVSDQLTSADLGTGIDGAVTLSASATLVRDMDYASLTVPAGVTLHTGGYVIRATGTVTINGTLDNSGSSATQPGGEPNNVLAGLGAPAGTLYGGANGVAIPLASYEVLFAVAGAPAPPADVQGGDGGATHVRDSGTGTAGEPGGSISISGASWLSAVGLRSARLGGGASGSAAQGPQSLNFCHVASGGAAGCVVVICNALGGGGVITATAGQSLFSEGTPGFEFAVGGSGGGVIAVACRNANSWTGNLNASGAPGIIQDPGGYSPTAQPGGPGRTGLLVVAS